jgi:hypothetical protein
MVVKQDLLNCSTYLFFDKYLQWRLLQNYACINVPNKSVATKCTNALHYDSLVVILIVIETFCFIDAVPLIVALVLL